MKNIYILILLALMAMLSCEEDGAPDLETGAIADFSKVETTSGFIEPALIDNLNIKFTLNKIVSDVSYSKIVIGVEYAGAGGNHIGAYEEISGPSEITVTIDKILSALPDLKKADITTTDLFRFYAKEIYLNDGRVISTKKIKVKAKTASGNDTLVYKEFPALTQDIAAADVFTQEIRYYVACPSSIEGTYTVVSSGKAPGMDATSEFTYENDITIARTGDFEYIISDFSGGLYKKWYSVYGAGEIEGTILELCGSIVANGIVDPWDEQFSVTASSIDPGTGVITVEWVTTYGEVGKNVYTPKN